jgi:hypothetical protein
MDHQGIDVPEDEVHMSYRIGGVLDGWSISIPK